MIQITINSSPDINKIGTITFNKNLIYIGNNHTCDLFISDTNLISNHLIIEIVESKMIVHPHKDIDFFLVNGKRTTGHKFVTLGNKIKIGGTEFTIDLFTETTYISMKETLNKLTDDLIKEESPLLDVIQELQRLDI